MENDEFIRELRGIEDVYNAHNSLMQNLPRPDSFRILMSRIFSEVLGTEDEIERQRRSGSLQW